MTKQNTISPETVLKISKLACISIQKEEITHLSKELSSILSWIEQLDLVPTDHVDPFLNPTAQNFPTIELRPDIIADGNIRPEILKNAPEVALDMFVVPRVID